MQAFFLDFKDGKLLYKSCSDNLLKQTFHLFDTATSQLKTFTSVNTAPPEVQPQGSALTHGTWGHIGDDVIFVSNSKAVSRVMAYDLIQNKTSQINVKYISGTFNAFGKKVCFTDWNNDDLYCHDYDPNYSYSVPSNIYNDKVIGGFNFAFDNNDSVDDYGHGTHVASIAAGNGVLKGVAPDARLLSYKSLDGNGSGFMSDVIEGIDRAVQTRIDQDSNNNVHVINLSLGVDCKGLYGSYQPYCGPDDPVSQAVDNAVSAGIVVIAAAGNNGPGESSINSPGTARKAITVGAVSKSKQLASFSSKGPVTFNSQTIIKPDVVAPGVLICAARWGTYQFNTLCRDNDHVYLQGTSMAAPHVAGIAALLLQANPDLTPDEIKQKIVSSATTLDLDSNQQGSGLVDAYKAVSTVIASPTPTPTPGAGITVDKTDIAVELNRKDVKDGVIKGSGIKITAAANAYADSWVIESNRVADQFGFWSEAGGLVPGQSIDNQLFINASKPDGTYTGSAKINYYKAGDLVSNGPTINYTISLKSPVCGVEVHSFLYNSNKLSRYYTTNTALFPVLRAGGWADEGTAFYAYQNQVGGAVPVYSFLYSGNRLSRYFTTNTGLFSLLQQYGWNNEGVAFYAYSDQVAGTVPVYSFKYSNQLDRYLTPNTWLFPLLGLGGWTNEGVHFYAYPNKEASCK